MFVVPTRTGNMAGPTPTPEKVKGSLGSYPRAVGTLTSKDATQSLFLLHTSIMITDFTTHMSAALAVADALAAENAVLRARVAELETQLAAVAAAVRPIAAPVPSPVAARAEPAAPAAASTPAIPAASDYRLRPEDIRTDVCVGRVFAGEDRRWTVNLLIEKQCGKKVAADGLCSCCLKRLAKYVPPLVETSAPAYNLWCGRVTEAPFHWQHMLGTKWAEASLASGKLRWTGVERPLRSKATAVAKKTRPSAADETGDGEVRVIDGDIYLVYDNTRVYVYDMVNNKPDIFAGYLDEEGTSIM